MPHSITVSLNSTGAPTTFIPNDFLCDLLDYSRRKTLDFRCAFNDAGVTLTFPSLQLSEAQRTLHNWERILPCDSYAHIHH